MVQIAFIALLFCASCTSDHDVVQKEDPESINSLYKWVESSRKKNDLSSAINGLNKIIKLDSVNSLHHYNISDVYFDLLEDRESYLMTNLNSALASKDTVAIDIAQQEINNCVQKLGYHLELSLKIDNKNHDALALKGKWFLIKAQHEEAIRFFNKSLVLDYNQEETHKNMGYAFKALQDFDKAINCFMNAVLINPEYFEAHMQLAEIFHLLDDTIALTHYNNALELEPSNQDALYGKAVFLHSQSYWDDALIAYAELHKVNYTHVDGHYNLGFIHMELGLYDIAVNNFSDAITSRPDYYQAYYAKGNCLETLGDVARAEYNYKKAIEINPEYKYAIEALLVLQENNKKYNKK